MFCVEMVDFEIGGNVGFRWWWFCICEEFGSVNEDGLEFFLCGKFMVFSVWFEGWFFYEFCCCEG